MPKERNSSHRHRDKDREPRSSSHGRGSHESRSEHDRRHTRNRRQRRIDRRPYHRETEPRSSTHIHFNGWNNVPSVSLQTDHVTLAANLTKLWEQREESLFANCFEMLGRLRSSRTVQPPGKLQQGSRTTTSGQRGVNHCNLATVPISVQKKSESFSGILETYKTASLVPAANTKERLLQSLVSHTEAKLDSIDISLLCPLTRSRMATPVRGRSCTHIHCFDGEAYLQLMWVKHVEKWKCPICKCLAPLSELVVDGYIMGILEAVPEDVKSVEFTPDGSWRKKKVCSSLPSINTLSDDCNPDQGNLFIDLTFDTPEKVVQKKLSDADGNFGRDTPPLVIDLTESP